VIANPDLYNASGSFDIRLKWVTDSVYDTEEGIPNYGCFVKDIQIDRTSLTGGYDTYAGTSMASPHVAGAAALAMSYRPNASIADIRNAIIWGGDFKNQLSDKIQSGNRLNILGMLQSLENPTITVEKVTISGESGVKIKVKTNPANMDAWEQITVSKDPEFNGRSGYL
jgi:subtilisin family serine protease